MKRSQQVTDHRAQHFLHTPAQIQRGKEKVAEAQPPNEGKRLDPLSLLLLLGLSEKFLGGVVHYLPHTHTYTHTLAIHRHVPLNQRGVRRGESLFNDVFTHTHSHECTQTHSLKVRHTLMCNTSIQIVFFPSKQRSKSSVLLWSFLGWSLWERVEQSLNFLAFFC